MHNIGLIANWFVLILDIWLHYTYTTTQSIFVTCSGCYTPHCQGHRDRHFGPTLTDFKTFDIVPLQIQKYKNDDGNEKVPYQ